MISNSEQQVRLQFLDEATEYLDRLETGAVGLGSGRLNPKQIDGILRAAHSIKGGAAMMSYPTLARIAHRLEDSLKVVQGGKKASLVDREVEGWFVSSVDKLRQIVKINRHGKEPDESWLSANVEPLLVSLLDRLGEPQLEDEASFLQMDSDDDIAVYIFETEVERALETLESQLTDAAAAVIIAAVTATAEELAGLSEMIELPALGSLSASIIAAISMTNDPVSVARSALAEWRRCQALVSIGQKIHLPTQLPGFENRNASPPVMELDFSNIFADDNEPAIVEAIADSDWRVATTEFDWQDLPDLFTGNLLNSDKLTPFDPPFPETAVAMDNIGFEMPNKNDFSFDASDFRDSTAVNINSRLVPDSAVDLFAAIEQASASVEIKGGLSADEDNGDSYGGELEAEATILFAALDAAEESSVSAIDSTGVFQQALISNRAIRIELQQVEQLTDLFGELAIARNGLDLQLLQMRRLVKHLRARMAGLSQSNAMLRQMYDLMSAQERKRAMSEGFDSLEFDRYTTWHTQSQMVMEDIALLQELAEDFETQLQETERTTRDLHRTSKLAQGELTYVRMRPVRDLFQRFPRALREMSKQYNKPVNLVLKGENTLIDRTILDALHEPMLHLVRNAFDHGIEPIEKRKEVGKSPTGKISLAANYRGNNTVITITDDGGGIDIEKVKRKALKFGIDPVDLERASDDEIYALIFEPGFSTAEKVTDLSGRGVGMDVVRTSLRELQGDVCVDTKLGSGTTFTITVPFSLSVIRVSLVDVGGLWLAFPSNEIEEFLAYEPEQLVTIDRQQYLEWEDVRVRLLPIDRWLMENYINPIALEQQPKIDRPMLLTAMNGEELVGLRIDRFWGEQEVTVRHPTGDLPMPQGFAGCCILGDGRLVPLVNINAASNWFDRHRDESLTWLDVRLPEIEASGNLQKTVLTIDDSINVRRFIALTLEKAGYRVEEAKDGQDALDRLHNGLEVDAVICDVEMPRLDGFGFLAAAKAQPAYQDLPIVMLTSRGGEKHRRIAFSLGAKGYLTKPSKEKELLETLQSVIDEKSPKKLNI
jgi:two-component system, chemotaxis family, sensor histidine kinase and response regulator PixL